VTTTLHALSGAKPPEAPAIGAPDRTWLGLGGLDSLTIATRASLHAAGIGRGDRVAIVRPDGPEVATAFVCVTQTAITAH